MPDFNTMEEVLKNIAAGMMVVVVDDESEDAEGNLIMAADRVTPAGINFMSREGGGLVAVAGTSDHIESLDLELTDMRTNTLRDRHFGITIDAREGTSSGNSAADRATTIRKFADLQATARDFARPGHVTTLMALDGGVLARAGHTEAAVDLARLAGCYPAGVLCQILDSDGCVARLNYLREFSTKHGLPMVSIRDLIAFRRQREKLVENVVSVKFPSRYGEFDLKLYESEIDDHHHLALVKGDVTTDEPVLVRVHSECLTGDVLGSLRCDCGDQLAYALQMIEKEGRGVVLYMRQEGRGIGLANKIRAYKLQDDGMDTVEANIFLGFPPDLRDYGIGAQILEDLGIRKIRLMTNNPKKIVGLEGYGLEIVERVAVEVPLNCKNAFYMQTKKDKMGHILSSDNLAEANKAKEKERG